MILVRLHTWQWKILYVFINSSLTVSCTSGWESFTTSWLGGVFLFAKERIVDNGRIRTYNHWFIIPVFSLEETSFLRSATYTSRCKDRYCWLSYKIKNFVNENFTKVGYTYKQIMFSNKICNNLKKHNITYSKASYINVINSVWRSYFTFRMVEYWSLPCYSIFAQ